MIPRFRAWDGSKIREVRSIHFDNHGNFEVEFSCKDYTGEAYDSCKLMQSTGLKDKNGVEIFEGDILKHDLWGITQVIWEHGMFRGTETKSGKDITLADHQLQRTRIIGNKFENSDLLEGV